MYKSPFFFEEGKVKASIAKLKGRRERRSEWKGGKGRKGHLCPTVASEIWRL